jgi:head-tail adaptor
VKNISAGDLRHRVAINRLASSLTPDRVGQVVASYQALGTFYALVEVLSGGEETNAKQRKGTLRFRVTVRAASGPILPTDQILWKGRTLNVVDAVPDPFGIMIEIECTEKVSPQ